MSCQATPRHRYSAGVSPLHCRLIAARGSRPAASGPTTARLMLRRRSGAMGFEAMMRQQRPRRWRVSRRRYSSPGFFGDELRRGRRIPAFSATTPSRSLTPPAFSIFHAMLRSPMLGSRCHGDAYTRGRDRPTTADISTHNSQSEADCRRNDEDVDAPVRNAIGHLCHRRRRSRLADCAAFAAEGVYLPRGRLSAAADDI